jgi:DNA-binding MarR family transcriptional regulator
MPKREVRPKLTTEDYQSLAEFRHRIRSFLHFSEVVVRDAGLEPRQHQLMLALKGLPSTVRPRISELAHRMHIQHHSAVELVNRLEAGGFVRRERGIQDRREVLLKLTPRGEKILRELSLHHRLELRSQGPALLESLRRLIEGSDNIEGKRK